MAEKQQCFLGVFLDFLCDELQIPGMMVAEELLVAADTGLGVEAALRVSRKQLPHLYGRKNPHHSGKPLLFMPHLWQHFFP